MLRALGVLLGAVILLAAGAYGALWAYDARGPLAEATAVVVPRGSLDQIGEVLATEGVIGNTTALEAAAVVTRRQGPVHAGEFLFPAGASLRQVLAVLRFGKPVQHKFTIPEGLTAVQVMALVQQAPAMEGAVEPPDEGSLLPETYAYEHATPRSAVIGRAAAAMDRALQQAWAAREQGSPLADQREALILASIVERETGKAEERPRVAAVFLNRLRRGMKLQSDATVVYGVSDGIGVLDHGLTRAELDRDTPYNTYRRTGLPPGPISMPGLATLKAVTQPMATDELYFVADGTGGHVFARTDAEHARNVARWRAMERQRAAGAAPK